MSSLLKSEAYFPIICEWNYDAFSSFMFLFVAKKLFGNWDLLKQFAFPKRHRMEFFLVKDWAQIVVESVEIDVESVQTNVESCRS
ncbi:hypothetical protein VNO80_30238 [Phaseolus coccineus]|uniref:Uncharacterized protein n=1 Tax=Phaseolus coccineus TaxID=3886 RepID=A0AAN9LCV1_PHACN